MITIRSTPDEIIKEGFIKFQNTGPTEVMSLTKNKIEEIDSYNNFVEKLQNEAKLEENDAHLIASATLYGFLEKFGINPDEWKLTVSPIERGKVKYGTEEYEEARKFLGSWTTVAELALFVATIASLITGGIAVVLSGSALRMAFLAIRTGKGIKTINTLWNLVKLRGIKWLTIPSIITAISTAWAYFAGTQITATGDLETYVKQGVARGEEAERLAQERATTTTPTTPYKPSYQPTIQEEAVRITKTKTAKPKMFIGIIMAGKITNDKQFIRQLDDAITDDNDLINDVKINLTNWLNSLPGKLTYEVQLKYNPFDEYNARKLGYWATLSLYLSNRFGKRMFLDDILLGPIDPLVYSPITGESQTITQEVAKDMIPTEIIPTGLPTGEIRTLTEEGKFVDIFGGTTTATPTPTETELEKQKAELEKQKAELERKIAEELAKRGGGGTPTVPPTPPIPPPPPIQTNAFNNGDIVIFNTGGSCLNERAEPGLGGFKVVCSPDGTKKKIADGPVDKDGYNWYRVENTDGTSSSWVAGQYLRKI